MSENVPAIRVRPAVVERAKPSAITFVVHSTPGFTNNALFFGVMDENLARWNITRVIAEEGSAVATMAAHWCKLHRIRLTVIQIDPTVAQVNDRPRRYRQMAGEGPDVALIFNQAAHWLDFARTLHDAGTQVSLVYSRGQQPDYQPWRPGMTKMPAVAKEREIARDVRKGRPRKLLTEAERKENKREATARSDEKRRLIKALSRPMRVSAIPRGRPKRTALKRHG